MTNLPHQLKQKTKQALGRWLSVDQNLPKENEAFFCFAGEFGYEIVSWIPYLLFLKQKTGIKINTIGRPGSKIFYYFSDSHQEAVLPSDLTGMWGDRQNYQRLAKRLGIKNLISPHNELIHDREIKINGYRWTNQDIHVPINQTNYQPMDLSSVKSKLPFSFNKFVVINNKYAKDGDQLSPNFFAPTELRALKDFLQRKGYATVYNRFIEPTAIDESYELHDEDIFVGPQAYDLGPFYLAERDPGRRNQVQVSAYNQASFVIGVQGGNLYLPAVCRKDILMLMKYGLYLDYTELGRIFKVKVDAFYEAKHLLAWLEKILPGNNVE